MSIKIYGVGIVFMSVCASKDESVEAVEAFVNQEHPTGVSSGWKIHDGAFKDGEPNPCPCPDDSNCQHWLLSC